LLFIAERKRIFCKRVNHCKTSSLIITTFAFTYLRVRLVLSRIYFASLSFCC